MRCLELNNVRNNADRINYTAGKDPHSHSESASGNHSGKKHQCAPAENNKKRDMNKAKTRGTEYCDQRNSKRDNRPLYNKEDNTKCISEVHQKRRSKGCADHQINTGIIKSSEKSFYSRAVSKCVV